MIGDLAAVWTSFADSSCGEYSPLYDRISRAVAAHDGVLALIQEAPPSGHFPTVLLAAVHYLLLGGVDDPLGAVYAGRSPADPGPLFVDFCLRHREPLIGLLASRHTNTNEVGRSAVLGLALSTVADRMGQPLGLIDVGCSAGLNLLCDRYLLDYGPAGVTGPSDAAVRVSSTVAAGRPPIAPVLPQIASRIGIDRDPVDVTDEDQARWLLAGVWPDTGRLPRARRAIAEARRAQLRLIPGDAVTSVGAAVGATPAGVVPVVVTTWALAYLAPSDRRLFCEELAAASRDRPVAWVSAEARGVVDLFADIDTPPDASGHEANHLGLVVFRDGRWADAEVLAFVHPHGSWIHWRG